MLANALAPSLSIDSGAVNPTLVAFAAKEFSYVFSNWTVTDPNSVTPLKIAGPGSALVASSNVWASYAGSGWGQRDSRDSGEVNYYGGFAMASAHAGDSVTIFYWCGATHDLYLGTVLGPSYGTFDVKLDGTSLSSLSCASPGISSAITGRRVLASGVSAGLHTLVLTLASSTLCYFDFCTRRF